MSRVQGDPIRAAYQRGYDAGRAAAQTDNNSHAEQTAMDEERLAADINARRHKPPTFRVFS